MPIDLFEIEIDLPYAKEKPKKFASYELPKFPELLYQENWADVGLYYNHEGIGGTVVSHVPFTGCVYPDYSSGDAFELYIATRPMQNASSVSRFCHQFVLFPAKMGDFFGKELSHFRGDDARPLTDPLPVEIQTQFDKKGYTMDFFIPKSALYGFEELPKAISFTYGVHAPKIKPQYFSVSSENFTIGLMPSLWALGNLLQHES